MRIAGMVMIGSNIDILCFQLGIHDSLTGIQSIISRQQIADTTSQGKVHQAAISK